MIAIPFTLIAPIIIVIWLLYRLLVYKKNKHVNFKREFVINLFFLYFLMSINILFFKSNHLVIGMVNKININFIPFDNLINTISSTPYGISLSLLTIISNALLFVPFGFIVPLLFINENKLTKITLYGLITSISIKLLQLLSGYNNFVIDDIIFNLLGTLLGFAIFNFTLYLLKETDIPLLVDDITSDYKGNLALLGFKPIIPIVAITYLTCLAFIYVNSVSGTLNNKSIAKEVFSDTVVTDYIVAADFFDYKLFLAGYKDSLEVQTAKRVLNNRWTEGNTYKLNIAEDSYGYSVMILDNDASKGIVVFGRNNDAQTIEITFNGKTYTEPLKTNTYFLVTFPTFEVLDANSDILNIYTNKESKDLVVSFKEKDGNQCVHMKLIK